MSKRKKYPNRGANGQPVGKFKGHWVPLTSLANIGALHRTGVVHITEWDIDPDAPSPRRCSPEEATRRVNWCNAAKSANKSWTKLLAKRLERHARANKIKFGRQEQLKYDQIRKWEFNNHTPSFAEVDKFMREVRSIIEEPVYNDCTDKVINNLLLSHPIGNPPAIGKTGRLDDD